VKRDQLTELLAVLSRNITSVSIKTVLSTLGFSHTGNSTFNLLATQHENKIVLLLSTWEHIK